MKISSSAGAQEGGRRKKSICYLEEKKTMKKRIKLARRNLKAQLSRQYDNKPAYQLSVTWRK